MARAGLERCWSAVPVARFVRWSPGLQRCLQMLELARVLGLWWLRLVAPCFAVIVKGVLLRLRCLIPRGLGLGLKALGLRQSLRS